LREFVDYTTEAISFIQYIINIGLTTIVKGLKPESQQRCQSITLKELLTTGEGRRLATNLADSLIEYTFSKINNTAYVVDVLTQHCKSFCGADDVLLYKATKQIFAARSANNETQAKAILTECLDILKKVALHIPADKANEIAQNFAYQRYYIYGIESALACAKARTTLQDKLPFYDIVFDLLYQFIIKDVSNQKKEVFAIAFGYGEKEYAFYMYEKFLAKNIGRQLIQVRRFIETKERERRKRY
jgi:nuclear pore complex protein Nup155